MDTNYEILLDHGEVLDEDSEGAFDAYRAVCIRNKFIPLMFDHFLVYDSIMVDKVIFNKVVVQEEE